jgi:hypothetical protein
MHGLDLSARELHILVLASEFFPVGTRFSGTSIICLINPSEFKFFSYKSFNSNADTCKENERDSKIINAINFEDLINIPSFIFAQKKRDDPIEPARLRKFVFL